MFDVKANYYNINIESSKRLFYEMKREKDKYEKLESLAYQDYIDTIKREISYTPLLYGVEKSKEWLRMLKEEKIDGRKKYDEKEHYNFLCNNLEERITSRNTTVTEIIEYGWPSYASIIKFTVENCDTIFALTIPDIKQLTKETMFHCSEGQLRLGYYSSDYMEEFICTSYKEQDIKDAFEKFMGENSQIKI